MTVVMIQEFDASPEDYDKVNEKMGVENNPPEGLIVHTAQDLGGGRMRVVDVWESADAFEKFAQERLGPAVSEVVGTDGPPPSDPDIRELHNVIKP